MNRLLPLLALLALGACTVRTPAATNAPVPAVSAQTRAADEAAITAALQSSAAGWNAADMDAHLAPYADSATFMTADGPARGKARTRELLTTAFWRDGRPAQQLSFSQLVVRPLGADHALVTGRFLLSGGGMPDQSGRFSLMWGRTRDGWRILHDHSS